MHIIGHEKGEGANPHTTTPLLYLQELQYSQLDTTYALTDVPQQMWSGSHLETQISAANTDILLNVEASHIPQRCLPMSQGH
jgi:hypothetical protein